MFSVILELNLILKEYESPLAIISSCIACYKKSHELCPNSETLKQLGNAYNELGNAYNNMAAGNYTVFVIYAVL